MYGKVISYSHRDQAPLLRQAERINFQCADIHAFLNDEQYEHRKTTISLFQRDAGRPDTKLHFHLSEEETRRVAQLIETILVERFNAIQTRLASIS